MIYIYITFGLCFSDLSWLTLSAYLLLYSLLFAEAGETSSRWKSVVGKYSSDFASGAGGKAILLSWIYTSSSTYSQEEILLM